MNCMLYGVTFVVAYLLIGLIASIIVRWYTRDYDDDTTDMLICVAGIGWPAAIPLFEILAIMLGMLWISNKIVKH